VVVGPLGGTDGRHAPYPLTGPAGQLLGRHGRPVDHNSDVLERHGEQVMEHEGHALWWGEAIQHDEQGETDRLRQDGLLLGL